MKLYNIAMADYNKMAMNIGFIVLVIYILIKAITAIFDFYGNRIMPKSFGRSG